MTTHPGKPARTPDYVAQCAQVLEHLLPPHHGLIRTRHAWYLRRWDAGLARYTDVGTDRSLSVLLARLGEPDA